MVDQPAPMYVVPPPNMGVESDPIAAPTQLQQLGEHGHREGLSAATQRCDLRIHSKKPGELHRMPRGRRKPGAELIEPLHRRSEAVQHDWIVVG